MWLVVPFYISNMSSQARFQLQSGYQVLPPRRRWDLCPSQLRQLERKDRHCRVVGGFGWRCCAQDFLFGSLAGFWDGYDLPSMFATKLDFNNWFKSWCFVVVPARCVSREQDGCLRLSLFLNMNFDVTQDTRQSSYLFVHDMWCQWCGVLAFLTLTTFGLCVPT